MEKNPVFNQVLRNSIWNFLMMFIRKAGGLIFIVIIARLLLPEKFGIYTLATTIIFSVLSFVDVGINQTLSRYTAEAVGKNNKKLAAKYHHFLLKIKIVVTITLAVVLSILAYPLSFYVFKKPNLFFPFLISVVYLLVLSFEHFYEMLFYTLRKVQYIQVKEIIFQISRIVLVFLLVFYVFKEASVSAVILTLVFSSLIALVFCLIYVKKIAGFLFKKSDAIINKKRVFRFLRNSIFSTLSLTFSGSVDIIIIGIFLASAYVGFYSAAFAIIAGLIAPITISNILLPVFTQMKREKFSYTFNKVFRYTTMLSIPLIFGLFVLGKYFLRLVYGYEYIEAAYPLMFLSLLIFGTPMILNLKSLFFAREKTKIVMKAEIYAAIINIILSVIFILSLLKISMIWAISGSAIATVISRGFVLIMLSVYAHKDFKVKYDLREVVKPIMASAIMALVLITINLPLGNMTLSTGIFEVIIGVAIYIIFMIFLKGFKKEDYYLIKTLKYKFKQI